MANYLWFQTMRVNLYIPKEIDSMKSEIVVSDFSLPFRIEGDRNTTLDGKEDRGGKRGIF